MKELFKITDLNMHYPVKEGAWGENIGFVYALNDVNLSVCENEIIGLVGESGSGKSTLGNCLLKLINPTSGEIIYKGENILNKSKKELKNFRKETRLIFQNPYMSLNPRQKIYDILYEPFIINNLKNKIENEKRLKEIIKLTGLTDEDLCRYPHEFSGGQRQRIAIARAIMLNPKFIVADEPVSALDVSIQAQIVNLLLKLKKELNLTMLFISHDLSIVKYISDRIAVLYLGEIVEIAQKDEFFNNYKHPYSKALINAVPLLNKKNNKKEILSGDIPSPQNPPKGCKFHTRCPFAFDKCKVQSPKLVSVSENHEVRCFLVENFNLL